MYEARSVSVFGSHDTVADDVDGALSVSVTSTVLVTPPPVTVMVPLFVPMEAVAVLMLTVTVPLLVPEAGLTDIHGTLSLAFQLVLEVTATV